MVNLKNTDPGYVDVSAYRRVRRGVLENVRQHQRKYPQRRKGLAAPSSLYR